jgi:excisionase family DNA binding protein
MMRAILNFNETAKFLNVKNSWLRMAIFKKTIPYIKVGRLLRFAVDDLNEWIAKNTIK